ncbi:MAG: glycoside hydrolase domain-containing protein, partial [Janthinobacterium lividum]
STKSVPIVKIVQSALYCKGYRGGQIDGVFDTDTAGGATSMKQDMGVAGAVAGAGVTPKVFKALLTMDAYAVVGSGTAQVRSIQQWLNVRYLSRRNFFIVPCDGSFSRDVQKAMMLAIQFELGMSDDVANGVFGPGTQSGLKQHTLKVGSSGVWVQLFSAAMVFNQRPGAAFASSFSSSLEGQVKTFQSFCKLTSNGTADFPTWASLLISTGDDTRAGSAFDCVTTITAPRAAALYARGYRYAGRYLSNVPGGTLDKMIKPAELATIVAGGLAVYPIYQTSGVTASYFSATQGYADGLDAVMWARYHGFKAGTRIYFAVDFDALDYQISDNVLPHFEAASRAVAIYGKEFSVGIYGPRNVCSRVAKAGYTSASFVSDMSTGFSGNLGFPLPTDWAFDQIKTITVGSGTGQVEIDNNIASGRDAGQRSFNAAQTNPKAYDLAFDTSFSAAMLADLRTYLQGIGVGESTAICKRTTAEAYAIMQSFDGLATQLSRTLKLRKALIQAPLFWEMRKLTYADDAADLLVQAYYAGQPGNDDCSTGLAQIFARTAILSNNYCTQQGIVAGTVLDPENTDDVWMIWQVLHDQDDKNVETVPLVLLRNAGLAKFSRPGLDASDAVTQKLLELYNGTGDAAVEYGRQLLGVYRVFEKYHKIIRER